MASEGLLLLTNDGGLARALELPASGLVRRYRARARGRIDAKRLDGLKEGITVAGVRYGPIEAHLDRAQDDETAPANRWITLSLAEGKNREVRKVLDALGLMVSRLIRVGYGPFVLGDLEPGQVAEVPGKALRDELGVFIAPANLPRGDRALFKSPPPAAPVRAPHKPRQGAERPEPLAYKPGWARPKIKASGSRRAAGPRPGPGGAESGPSSPPRNSRARRRDPRPGGGPKPPG